jgi:predicted CoA-binding protein
MDTINRAAAHLLAMKRVAVNGVSRNQTGHGGNVVQRVRERGYEVFALNVDAQTLDGDTAYPNLKSIPGGVEAVLIGTKSEAADATWPG